MRGRVVDENDMTFDSIYQKESDMVQPRASDNYKTTSRAGKSMDPMKTSLG